MKITEVKGLLVLNTLIHFNNFDGLTSQCVASKEEDKEDKAKWLYNGNGEEKRRICRPVLSANPQLAAVLVKWTVNGAEGYLTGG